MAEQGRAIMNLMFFALAGIFIGSMQYQWIRHICLFSPDNKGLIACSVQGGGIFAAAVVNFITVMATKSTHANKTVYIVHFVFYLLSVWGSIFLIVAMNLDSYQNSSTEPMLKSSEIDTEQKNFLPDNEPKVNVVKSDIDNKLEGIKFLPLEKKMIDLFSSRNNLMYMGIMTLLITGVNYPYYINMWFNKLLEIGSALGNAENTLANISKAPLIIVGKRIFNDLIFSLAEIPFGYFADKYPKRYLIMAAYGCSTASCLFFFWFEKPSFGCRWVSFILSSIGYGGMNAILLVLVMEKYLIKNIMDAVSIIGICYYLTAFLFGYISLFVLGYFGRVNLLFAFVFGVAINALIFLILTLKEPFITSPHYFDANYVDNNKNNEKKEEQYNQPNIPSEPIINNQMPNPSDNFNSVDNLIKTDPQISTPAINESAPINAINTVNLDETEPKPIDN